jgi:ankyrin repeat protein
MGRAFFRGRVEVVKALLAAGCDVNMVDYEHSTALVNACAGGHIDLVKLLVRKGADINVEALCTACSESSPEVVKFLLQRSANPNVCDARGKSPLQCACFRTPQYADAEPGTDVELVDLLLASGADVNYVGGPAGTALHAACRAGGIEVIDILLDSGVDINAIAGDYGTALQAACSSLYSERNRKLAVRLLLARGADPDLRGGEYGSAIDAALKNGLHQVAQILQSASRSNAWVPQL